MNVGRFLACAAAVWLVRVALNWTFYTRVIGQQSQQIAAAHPGIFRDVVPGFILTDLIFALAFTYLFVKVGAALGGGETRPLGRRSVAGHWKLLPVLQRHVHVGGLDHGRIRFALAYTEADVLHFELPNAPGALAKFARKVAQKDINITLGYATSEKGSKKTSVVLAVSDLDKAAIIR